MNTPSPPPRYRQIAAAVQARIDDGTYPPGSALPSEESLAAEFGVTRPTVRQGLAELRATDAITVMNGKGAFVSDPAQRRERPSATTAALRRERDTAWSMAAREAAAVTRVLDLATQLETEGLAEVAARIRTAIAPE